MQQLNRGQRIKLSQVGLGQQLTVQVLVNGAAITPTVIAAITNNEQRIETPAQIVTQKQSHAAIQVSSQTSSITTYLLNLEQLPSDQQIALFLSFPTRHNKLFSEIKITIGTALEFTLPHAEYAQEQSLILGVFYHKENEARFHAYGNGYYDSTEGLTTHFKFDFRSVLEPKVALNSSPPTPSAMPHQLPIRLPSAWAGRQNLTIPSGLVPSIQFIAVTQADGQQSSGSGFAVSPGGYIITCHHVIEDANSISIITEQSTETRDAIVVATDEHHDLALLYVTDNQGFTDWLVLDLDREPQLGDELGLLAYPLGTTFGRNVTYSKGIINGIRQQDGTPFLQIDTGAAPGSSGGAIFSSQSGKVVGVLHGGLPLGHGMIINLGVDIRNLKQLGWVIHG